MTLDRKGKALLVLALVTVVAMAFRVSWNALRDVARAIGADDTAATLYPVVVDGLMALALVATLVLVGPDRTFALRVLGTYTLASLVLNYVHGLVPGLHGDSVDWGRLADWDPANYALVLLATSLPVGAIYFGSDLVAKILDHRPAPAPEPMPEPAEPASVPVAGRSMPVPVEPATDVPVLGPWTPVAELTGGTGGTGTGTGPDLYIPAEQDGTGLGAEPTPEPPEPSVVPPVPDPGSGTTGSGSEVRDDTVFGRQVGEVRNWLREEPELTGTAIGTRLGTSDAYGRRVRRAALHTAGAAV
ncbi:DUF2637 domain-containing protein [Streptomyces uncialis]|uniref:DUF2637 domain-containing protein n=1 Tax=Streptomyces uncialis TaxID=1048205 RepID=UPI002E36CBA6|nr:DUF2637 domain-containing protein [Streptomyces uncialis]